MDSKLRRFYLPTLIFLGPNFQWNVESNKKERKKLFYMMNSVSLSNSCNLSNTLSSSSLSMSHSLTVSHSFRISLLDSPVHLSLFIYTTLRINNIIFLRLWFFSNTQKDPYPSFCQSSVLLQKKLCYGIIWINLCNAIWQKLDSKDVV